MALAYPGLRLRLVERRPIEALRLLRHSEDEEFRLVHLGDDPIHLISRQPGDSLANHRDSDWIGGCRRRPAELTGCRRRIHATTYGEPPDPPAVAAMLAAPTEVGTSAP